MGQFYYSYDVSTAVVLGCCAVELQKTWVPPHTMAFAQRGRTKTDCIYYNLAYGRDKMLRPLNLGSKSKFYRLFCKSFFFSGSQTENRLSLRSVYEYAHAFLVFFSIPIFIFVLLFSLPPSLDSDPAQPRVCENAHAFLGIFPSHLLSSPFFSLSLLLVVIQIRGRIAL